MHFMPVTPEKAQNAFLQSWHFIGNTGDALCREPQTRPAHWNRFAFCYQEGQTAARGLNEKLTTAWRMS